MISPNYIRTVYTRTTEHECMEVMMDKNRLSLIRKLKEQGLVEQFEMFNTYASNSNRGVAYITGNRKRFRITCIRGRMDKVMDILHVAHKVSP